MSRAELMAVVDRSTRGERNFLLAYLRTKDPEYRRKLGEADRSIDRGQAVRLRTTSRGLARVRSKAS